MSSELTSAQSLAVLAMRYGGLAAEQHVMGDYGRGVIGDLKQAALAAGEHVDLFGMRDKPPIFYEAIVQGVRLRHAERERQLWEEIEKLLTNAHATATMLVNENSPLLHRIMEELFEKHHLSREELLALHEEYMVKDVS